jgi:hypothetical protein
MPYACVDIPGFAPESNARSNSLHAAKNGLSTRLKTKRKFFSRMNTESLEAILSIPPNLKSAPWSSFSSTRASSSLWNRR